MPITALQAANALITLANQRHQPLDQLKLQKLLYLAQGTALAVLDKPLFLENIEAWKYGPVVAPVYRAAKMHGRNAVTVPLTSSWGTAPQPIDADRLHLDVITRTLNTYGDYTGAQLIALTHDPHLPEGRPWAETFASSHPNANLIIPTDLMCKSFQALSG